MTLKAKNFFLVCVLAISTILTACGGGGGGNDPVANTPAATTYSEHLYVGNNGDNSISQYIISTTDGTLSPNSPASENTLEVQNWIAISPGKDFAYITRPGTTHEISQYTINNDGTLTLVASDATGTDPWGVAINTAGTYAYVANYTSNTISQFTIAASSGLLSSIGLAPTPTGSPAQPQVIVIHPTLNYLYVTYFTTDVIVQFSIQPDGTLLYVGTTTTSGTSPISSPLSMVIDPSGQYLYIANSGTDNVSQFSINASTGVLTAVDTFSSGVTPGVAPFTGPSSISIDPAGQNMYVANNTEESVTHFSIGAGGTLTKITDYTSNTTGAYATTFSPTGAYFFVTDDSNARVNQFRIGAAGALITNGAPVNSISLPEAIKAVGITR